MVSKFFYFVAILAISHVVQADASLPNEPEKFSSGGIQSVTMTQPEDAAKFKEIADINVNELSEQSLKGSRSHQPRNLFRQPLLMVTQPFETIRMDEDSDDGDDQEGNGQGLDDDTVAGEEEEEAAFIEGVKFSEYFDTAKLFTELSFLPTQATQWTSIG